MQMAPLTFYCEQCGAANAAGTTTCFACHQPVPVSLPADQESSSALSLPTPPSSPAGLLLPGSLFHYRYEIVSVVGQGGFSVVYAAKDTKRKHKQVAIKQINLRSLTPRQIIDATDTYNREVKLLSKLNHAHLPHMHDHFTDPDHWYLVMDYIEGETLEDYVGKAKQGYLPVKEVLAIGMQLCTVLNYLHKQIPRVIFRDVKPSNIMRTSRGRLFLIDFGIARRFTPGQNKDTGPLGTPGYAAPEQYGTAQTTMQTDIYGLGATLQTLLTGHEPLEPSPSTGQPLPPKLRQLLDHMLDPDADKRPKSVHAVKMQLLQIKRGKIGTALPFLWGLLIGSLPYSLILLLFLTMTSFPQLNALAILGAVFQTLYFALLCTWPFVLVVQLTFAIRFLFSPPTRLMGLGMLSMLVFLAVALSMMWLPSPFLSPFFVFFH